MVFKRRDKLGWRETIVESVWPKRGWKRTLSYFQHRIRRLPDTPERVARGMFAGTFAAMLPPVPGVQFALAWVLALIGRGNVLASLACTFLSNPVTTPFIAVGSIGIGQWMLGQETTLRAGRILRAFADAGDDLWRNAKAPFTDGVAHWAGLARFFDTIFLPYLLGSMVIGLVCGLAAYYLTIPLVGAYQRARVKRLRDKAEKQHRRRGGEPAPLAMAEEHSAQDRLPGN